MSQDIIDYKPFRSLRSIFHVEAMALLTRRHTGRAVLAYRNAKHHISFWPDDIYQGYKKAIRSAKYLHRHSPIVPGQKKLLAASAVTGIIASAGCEFFGIGRSFMPSAVQSIAFTALVGGVYAVLCVPGYRERRREAQQQRPTVHTAIMFSSNGTNLWQHPKP